MSHLTDIKLDGGRTFEEIDIWFCQPAKQLLLMFDESCGDDSSPEWSIFYFEMQGKIDDLSKTLIRLFHDYNKTQKAA